MEKKSEHNTFKLYFICLLVVLFNPALHAEEHPSHELELSAIADLTHVALKNEHWHAVLPVLGNNKQYFIATDVGKIYNINHSKASQSAFFDLKSALNTAENISLTAIALDPSFNSHKSDGYHTFYTAHTELSKNITPKLTAKATELSLPYDTVITRWQLTYAVDQEPQLNQHHEVMRIAIEQKQQAIQQLSFNPYIERWHDDFGLLFITLAKSDNLAQEALYAGAILRIKPKIHGRQNYTIPSQNPFFKKPKILNEIVFIAGQKIAHFDWIKKGADDLLLHLNQQNSHQLFSAKIGDDWRTNSPTSQLSQYLKPTNQQRNALLYHGRELKDFWGKMLHLEIDAAEKLWKLYVSALDPTLSNEASGHDQAHNLNITNMTTPAIFSLHQRHNGELLVLEHNDQRLYAIKKTQIAQIAQTKATIIDGPISPPSNYSTFAVIILLIIMLTGIAWYLRTRTGKLHNLLHQQWANFDVDLPTQSLYLYKRHAKSTETVIKISALMRSELLLNGKVISTISADPAHAFSNQLENSVLTIFAKESQLKMVDEKQRKIQLRLTDHKKNRYLFCLYFRVGNMRHTKLKYSQVLTKSIDWHWLFSQYINPVATSKRKIKFKQDKSVTQQELASTEINTDQLTTLDEPLEIELEKGAKNNQKPNTDDIDNDTSAESELTTTTEDLPNSETQLITALDQLVMMKKQGYLDENEFNIAKTRILNELANAPHTD